MQRRRFTFALALAAASGFAHAQRGDRLLQLQPMAAASPGETHSALAVSNQAFGGGGVPYRFAGQVRTVRQLRTPKPNAWEVAWLFWNFVDNNHL